MSGDPLVPVPVVQTPPRIADTIHVVVLVATGTNGGTQEHVTSLLEGFDRERFDLRVIALSSGSSVARWRASGVPVEVIAETDDDAAVAVVADHLMAWETQVLHAHMYRAEVIGARASARLQRRGQSRPWVIGHVHSSRVRSLDDQALLRSLDPAIDRLVAVSRAIEAKLCSERSSSTPVSLVYNGVDLDRFKPPGVTAPARKAATSPGPLVGCVARLEPEKGHETLLRAWAGVLARMPHARLMIVGEGSCLDALQGQAQDLGMTGDQAEFTGRRDDVPALTKQLDVAVLASYREAQGLAVLEAMATGRPVVASRVGGIVEMVQHERTGLLVEPGDPDALAAAMVRLLGNWEEARRFGLAGREVALARFGVERMLADISALYEEGAAAWERQEWAVRPIPA